MDDDRVEIDADIAAEARDAGLRAAIIELSKALIDEAVAKEREKNDRLHNALSQLVGWVEECGSGHEGREYALMKARSALKGFKIVR